MGEANKISGSCLNEPVSTSAPIRESGLCQGQHLEYPLYSYASRGQTLKGTQSYSLIRTLPVVSLLRKQTQQYVQLVPESQPPFFFASKSLLIG